MFENLVEQIWQDNNNKLECALALAPLRIQDWNRNVFGNIFHMKVRYKERLEGIQRVLSQLESVYLDHLEKRLMNDMEELLAREEEFWEAESQYAMDDSRRAEY